MRFTMPPLPMILSAPSASLKEVASPCTSAARVSLCLHWLESLPTTVLDARPSLWVTYASALFFVGQHTAVEQKLQAAEACLAGQRLCKAQNQTKQPQDLVGRIATYAPLWLSFSMMWQPLCANHSRALENLHPDNLLFRSAALWTLGYAYHLTRRSCCSQPSLHRSPITTLQSFADSIYDHSGCN